MSDGESGGAGATDQPQAPQDSGSVSGGVDGFNFLASMSIGGFGGSSMGMGTGSSDSGGSSGSSDSGGSSPGDSSGSDSGGSDSGGSGHDRPDGPGYDNKGDEFNTTSDGGGYSGTGDSGDSSMRRSDDTFGSGSVSENEDTGRTDRPPDTQPADSGIQPPEANRPDQTEDRRDNRNLQLQGNEDQAGSTTYDEPAEECTPQGRMDKDDKGSSKRTFLSIPVDELPDQSHEDASAVSKARFLPGNEKGGQRLSDGKTQMKSWDQVIGELNQIKKHGDMLSDWNSQALKEHKERLLKEPGTPGNIARDEHKTSHPGA